MTKPSSKWIESYIRAAAMNTYAARHNAPIRAQQRFYDKWMKLRTEGMSKWPNVDFDAGLASAVDKYLHDHPLRGPGVDW